MTIRQEKFSRQLQRDIANIFQEKGREWFGGQMISVASVQVSPDLSFAKIYLSMFTTKNRQEIMDSVELYGREIRQELARRIRHEVRKIPELAFYLDESLDYADRMDRIFDQLNKDKKEDNPEQ